MFTILTNSLSLFMSIFNFNTLRSGAQQNRIPMLSYYSVDGSGRIQATTTSASLSKDPVRWLINRQSFNGAWLLNKTDIKRLTNGKSLNTFQSILTKNKGALTTAIAIAVLELKYDNEKNLWYGVVQKARKRLHGFGLSSHQVDMLINEIKNKL